MKPDRLFATEPDILLADYTFREEGLTCSRKKEKKEECIQAIDYITTYSLPFEAY